MNHIVTWSLYAIAMGIIVAVFLILMIAIHPWPIAARSEFWYVLACGLAASRFFGPIYLWLRRAVDRVRAA